MAPSHSPPVFFAALSPRPSLLELVAFQLNGLLVVAVALMFIWGLMELLGAFFRRRDAAAPRSTPPLLAPPLAVPVAPGRPDAPSAPIPATDLVLIAAAVHATLGPRARIIALAPRLEGSEWAVEGRRTIFATHKVR